MVRSQCFHIPACVLECQQRVARAHACMSCWVPSAMPRGWSVGTSFCRLQVSYGMCAQGVQHRAALRAGAQDGRGQRQARLRAGGVLHAHQAAAGAPGAVAAQRHERELQAQVLRHIRHVLPPHARAVAAGQGARAPAASPALAQTPSAAVVARGRHPVWVGVRAAAPARTWSWAAHCSWRARAAPGTLARPAALASPGRRAVEQGGRAPERAAAFRSPVRPRVRAGG